MGSYALGHEFQSVDPHRSNVAQLEDALLLIDPLRKHAYIEALKLCPQVVKSESNPIHFLLFEKYNVWSAAERIVNYWQLRLQVFGSRCFLPLDLSGQGALDAEDIEGIKKGYSVITCDDTIILCHDATIYNEPVKRRVRRSFFFMQQFVNSPSNSARCAGINILLHGQNFDGSGLTRETNQILQELIQTAFPVRVKAVHRVVFHASALQAILPRLLDQVGLWSGVLNIHHCSSPFQAMEKLAPHGIVPSSLPTSLGGTLDLHRSFVSFLVANKLPLTPSAFSGVLGLDDTENIRVLSGLKIQSEGRIEVRREARGNQDPVHDPPTYAAASPASVDLSKLDEAVDMLPDCEKEAYLWAKNECPHLIQQESNPEDMLRMEKFNVWEVARKLTTYWKNRVMVFGERASLPLTLTGALYDEDAPILSSGCWVVPGTDKWGRSVLVADPAKLVTEHSLKSRLRVMFYIMNVVLQNPKTVQEGYVLFLVIGGRSPQDKSSTSWSARRLITDVCLQSFSMRPAITHVIYCRKDKQTFLSGIFPLIFKAGSSILKQNAQYHIGDPDSDLIAKFEKLGIDQKCMPERVGGEVDAMSFIRQRNCCESVSDSGGESVGTTSDSFEGELAHQETSKLVVQIMEALDRIPNQKKTALVEALANHPNLVKSESDYSTFLRFTDFNVDEAANLLVRYWKTRKELFGARAFLPVNQTGDGILDKKDIVALQSSYLMQLPCDSNGRSVVYCDGSKLQKPRRQSELRCAFYIFSVIAENKVSQTEGHQILYCAPNNSIFDQGFALCLESILNCVPVKLKQFHVLGVQPRARCNASSMLNERLREVISELPATTDHGIIEHIMDSRRELVDALVPHGISKTGIPKSFGGEWSFQDFLQWQELRIRHEWNLPISVGIREAASRLHITARSVPSTDLTDSERVERKRRLNVIHARRRRERDRLDIEGMLEQAAELKDENERLKLEGARLEELVQKAQAVTK